MDGCRHRPGAKEFLKENAGLRAKILTDGELHLGDAQLRIVKDVEASVSTPKTDSCANQTLVAHRGASCAPARDAKQLRLPPPN